MSVRIVNMNDTIVVRKYKSYNELDIFTKIKVKICMLLNSKFFNFSYEIVPLDKCDNCGKLNMAYEMVKFINMQERDRWYNGCRWKFKCTKCSHEYLRSIYD